MPIGWIRQVDRLHHRYDSSAAVIVSVQGVQDVFHARFIYIVDGDGSYPHRLCSASF